MSQRQDREKKKRENAKARERWARARAHQAAASAAFESREKAAAVAHRSHEQYLGEWRPNSENHQAQGDYEWMSSFLCGYEKVLEIGVGDGRSTLSIQKGGHAVIGIDENPACLIAAGEILKAAGLTVTTELRGTVRVVDDHHYANSYTPPTSVIFAGSVALVEGDVLCDPSLLTWLSNIAPFDAVICWLMGTHGARKEGVDTAVSRQACGDPSLYRLQVQNAIYTLADRVLRPGGILHIVDRGEAANEDYLKQDILDAHREQAEPTTLQVEALDYRLLPAMDVPNGIEMRRSPGLSGRIVEHFEPALLSVISRKPM